MDYRQANLADLEKLVKLENEAWPEGTGANKDQIISRISIFPEGVIVAYDGEDLVGAVMAEIVNYETLTNEIHSWAEITNNGLITTHNERGDVLFGVDLSVKPSHRKVGVGGHLLLEIGKMAIRKNLKGGILGARMPDYHKYSNTIPVNEYINQRDEVGNLIDSELRFYERNGLKFIKVVPNYFPDPESLNFGLLCYWKNPFYVRNARIGRAVGKLGASLFKL